MSVEPFRIHVEQLALDDLGRRLKDTRLARFTGSGGWDYGTSPEYLDELLEYWQTQYDWRRQEAGLNGLPHFKARAGKDDLHFVHARAAGEKPVPLLLLHSWPDSFYRYYKLIPRLSNPAAYRGSPADSFHVVVPSLPGFAFSRKVKLATGSQPFRQTAALLWQLMTETLGYERFAVAGGGFGSAIAQVIALDHPESVIGLHLTDIGRIAASIDSTVLTPTEQKYLAKTGKETLTDGGYANVHRTKPVSLAPALRDSPAGLASWIVDRFHSWSDSNGNIYTSFTQDEMLTNIMLYWITDTVGTSIAYYNGEAGAPSLQRYDYVTVPVGMALFPKEIGGIPPRALAQRWLNVQRWTEMPHGGHFAALEVPELYAADLADFFREYRDSAPSVVSASGNTAR